MTPKFSKTLTMTGMVLLFLLAVACITLDKESQFALLQLLLRILVSLPLGGLAGFAVYLSMQQRLLRALAKRGHTTTGTVTFIAAKEFFLSNAGTYIGSDHIHRDRHGTNFLINVTFYDNAGRKQLWRSPSLEPDAVFGKEVGDSIEICYLTDKPSVCYPVEYFDLLQKKIVQGIWLLLVATIICFSIYVDRTSLKFPVMH